MWSLALVWWIGCAAEAPSTPPEPAPAVAAPAVAEPVAPAPPALVAPSAPSPAPAPPRILALPEPGALPNKPEGLDNGDWAVQIAGTDHVTGRAFRLSEHVGPGASGATQAVLVSFSASWCGPCQASLPQLAELVREHQGALKVVIVSTDSNTIGLKKELQAVKNAGLDAVVVHSSEPLSAAWLGGRRNIPHMYILNRAGQVMVQDRGYGDNVKRVLPGQIRYALNHPEPVAKR